MIRLIYDPLEGLVLPDGKIEEWLLRLQVSGASTGVTVGSHLLIDNARALVREGRLSDVVVISEGKEHLVDSDGFYDNYPEALYYFDDVLCRLLFPKQ